MPPAKKTSKKTSKKTARKTSRKPGPADYPRLEPDQPLDRFNPAPYNPRKDLQPGDPEFERLRASIESFDHAGVLIGNARTGNLVGGHQTLKVLRHLGRSTADYKVVDLSLDREKALNVALNRISGAWDHDKLDELMTDLRDLDPDMVDLAGFDPDALDDQLAALKADLAPASNGPNSNATPAATDDDTSGGGGGGVDSSYLVVVACRDENHQQQVYTLLKEAGEDPGLRTIN
jgi:hypothetical protein